MGAVCHSNENRCHRSKTELEVQPTKYERTAEMTNYDPRKCVCLLHSKTCSPFHRSRDFIKSHWPPPAEVRLAARRRWETWGFVGEAGGAASGIGWSSVKFSSNGAEARWRTAAGDGTVIATLEEGELVLLIACRFFCIVSLSLYC